MALLAQDCLSLTWRDFWNENSDNETIPLSWNNLMIFDKKFGSIEIEIYNRKFLSCSIFCKTRTHFVWCRRYLLQSTVYRAFAKFHFGIGFEKDSYFYFQCFLLFFLFQQPGFNFFGKSIKSCEITAYWINFLKGQ